MDHMVSNSNFELHPFILLFLLSAKMDGSCCSVRPSKLSPNERYPRNTHIYAVGTDNTSTNALNSIITPQLEVQS
jgi:hypothetical protein